jgi:hypothetical protein
MRILQSGRLDSPRDISPQVRRLYDKYRTMRQPDIDGGRAWRDAHLAGPGRDPADQLPI